MAKASISTMTGGNGYCKLPDGTMMCWGTTGGYGGVSRTVDVTLPFPFADTSYVVELTTAPLNDTENYRGVCNTLIAKTTTTFTVRQENIGRYDDVHSFNWIAIGRWK